MFILIFLVAWRNRFIAAPVVDNILSVNKLNRRYLLVIAIIVRIILVLMNLIIAHTAKK